MSRDLGVKQRSMSRKKREVPPLSSSLAKELRAHQSWSSKKRPSGSGAVAQLDWTGRQVGPIKAAPEFANYLPMSGSLLMGADFRGSDLRMAAMEYAQMDGAIGAGSDLSEAHLTGSSAIASNFDDCSFRGAQMEGTIFISASLEESDFSGANAMGGNFQQAKLRGANFTGADLTGARFVGANLTGADFTGAKTAGADFRGANLDRAINGPR
jgi:Pentapeptide repeats (9 copies)